jgi:hypothetical protein
VNEVRDGIPGGRRAGREPQGGRNTAKRDGTGRAGDHLGSHPTGSSREPRGLLKFRIPPVPSRPLVSLPPWRSSPARRPRTSFTCFPLPYRRLLALLVIASATCPNCVTAVSSPLGPLQLVLSNNPATPLFQGCNLPHTHMSQRQATVPAPAPRTSGIPEVRRGCG